MLNKSKQIRIKKVNTEMIKNMDKYNQGISYINSIEVIRSKESLSQQDVLKYLGLSYNAVFGHNDTRGFSFKTIRRLKEFVEQYEKDYDKWQKRVKRILKE